MYTNHAVIAGIDLNGLGLLRALGHAGVPVVGVDTDIDKPTARSRFGTKLRLSALSGPLFIEELLKLRDGFTCDPVLILTQEASVATVSAAGERLAGAYRFSMPPQALMDDLMNKGRFQILAEAHGCPIPRAVLVNRVDGVDPVRDLRFPCVLKPTTKHALYGRRFAKAYRVTSITDVEQHWAAMREIVDEIIVQEWIEGGDAEIYFCLQYRGSGGRMSFVGRKTCQWPRLVGGTASCIPAPEFAAELTELTDWFFGAVGFSGLGSIEYKRDTRDGRFYMVEPTVGRTDLQEEIAVLNGVNIPLAAYCGELGLPLPDVIPTSRHAWRDRIGYAMARMADPADVTARATPGIRICDAYFRIDDPMPYWALMLQAARRRLTRATSCL